MNKKDFFKKMDKENQAKNALLNIEDQNLQDFLYQPFSLKKDIKQKSKLKYAFFERLSKPKQKRRVLKQLRVNSNSQIKRESNLKKKDSKDQLQTIKQLKGILQKLQSKQIKTSQKSFDKQTVNIQNKKIVRAMSVNQKKRQLSFINNKNSSQIQISVNSNTQPNFILIKKTKNVSKNSFFDLKLNQNEKTAQTYKRKYSQRNNESKFQKVQVNQRNNLVIDNLSMKTLNILHQINNLRTKNCQKKYGQSNNIKINPSKKTSNPQHFLSVRI